MITQIINPQNNVTTFEYNSLDQMIKKTTTLVQITELAYDPNGNVVWEKDPNGNIKTFEYSDTDQVVRKVLPDNLYQMSYDDNDNLTAISDNDSALAFTYEKVGDDYLVKTVNSQGTELPNVTLTNNYDRFGNRIQLQTPYGNFGYTYDVGNRLTNVSNPFGENFGFQYDDVNRLRVITRPGSTTNLDFDQNSFLTSMVHKRGTSTITQAIYTSDAIGNRVSKITPEGSHNYSYDENYQLKTASNPEGGSDYSSETFNYDSLGNRTNDQLGAYAYDNKKQRLLEDYQNFYSYDSNGNLVTKSRKGMNGTTVNYIYSSENQLIEVQFIENYLAVKNVYYRYDALGRRAQRTVIHASNPNSPVSRAWVYDGNEILAEHDGELNHLATYTHSTLRTDNTLSVRVTSAGASAGIAYASGSYQYLMDALGTVVAVVDNSGNLVQRYVYSVFGKILSIKDASSNEITTTALLKTAYSFTNREWDEDSGLYYYRARYYDPHSGRFLTEDPHPGKQSNPQTAFNKYIYSGNNPTNFIDPDGKFFFLAAALISGSALSWGTFGVGATILLSSIAATSLGAGISEIAASRKGELGDLYKSSKFWEGVGVSFGANLLTFGTLRWMGLIGKTANTGAYVVEAKNWLQAAKVGAYFGAINGLIQSTYYASTGAIDYDDVGKYVLTSAAAGAITFGIGKAFWPKAAVLPTLLIGAGENAVYINMVPGD